MLQWTHKSLKALLKTRPLDINQYHNVIYEQIMLSEKIIKNDNFNWSHIGNDVVLCRAVDDEDDDLLPEDEPSPALDPPVLMLADLMLP